MPPHRLMAEHQSVRLGTVSEAHRDACVGGVEERALPFHAVPVIGVGVRRERLHRAGDEIGDDRVDCDTCPGDQDPGLAGGAEVGRGSPRAQLPFHRQRGVHLAAGAVGTDREEALAAALASVAYLELLRGESHVEEAAPMRCRGLREHRHVGEPIVQARREVHARFERLPEHVDPTGVDHPAAVGHPHHERLGAGRAGLGHRHLGQSGIGRRSAAE